MSGFLPGFVLGVLLGLAVGLAACWGVARVLMRVAGLQDLRGLGRFLLAGLRRHGRHDAVEVERTLSRALKDQYSVLASGTRVAATAVTLKVSPEDHAVLRDGLGVEAAAADLADFYRRHAASAGWQVLADPVVTVERDISLKPREAVAQRSTRAPGEPPAGRSPGPDRLQAAVPEEEDPTVLLPAPAASNHTTPLPFGHRAESVEGVTEVLPSAAASDGVVVRNGRTVVRLPATARRASIGRAPGSDVRVQAHGVADEHALLERRGTDWYLVPLPRAGPTAVGGEPVDEPVRLSGTNIVGIGRVARLEVTVGE